jgi:uncharacterized protein YecE (DUF72 family)
VDFGRLPDLAGVSFALPPLDGRSRAVLAAGAAGRAAGQGADPDEEWLRTGAPAWARKDWLGRFYPRGASDKDFLHLYARKCGAIELNASYYRVPTEDVLDAWAADVPASFHFCPKLHQSITHRRALAESIPEAQGFAERFLRLGSRLGPAFLQLPPWAGDDLLPALDALLEALPPGFRVAVEMRHPSWFQRGALIPRAAAVLERRGAGAVITDVAGRRDVCHGSVTAPFVLVRFVGNGLHPTDVPRADAWLERLVEWRSIGLDRAYFFAHQPDDALAPETLAHFTGRARERGLHMPAATIEAAQLDLFGGAPPATGTARVQMKGPSLTRR